MQELNRANMNKRMFLTCLVAAHLAHVAMPALARGASAPPILLAKVLDPSVDPAHYLVSEKFDGVRAIWDGKTLRFRSGATVNAPAWFIAKLPAQSLDGELWLARGKFETLSGFVRKTNPVDDEWRQIKFLIFELPQTSGSDTPFSTRAEDIERIVKATNWPQLVAVKQFRIADRVALKRKLDEVVKGGGEGLMLHRANAPYVTGRSDVLLKLKHSTTPKRSSSNTFPARASTVA